MQAGKSDVWDAASEGYNWGAYSGYTIPSAQDSGVTAETVKDYVISKTAQTDARFENSEADTSTYTARDVVKLATTQSASQTKDRFYVMGLDDITDGTNDRLYWYYSAYSRQIYDYASVVSSDFGTGRQNTATIKAKWDLGEYGTQNQRDLWGYLPTTPKAGANAIASASDTLEYRWFIPSREEWAAFADAFGINYSNWGNFGLDFGYNSSSLYDKKNCWTIAFYQTCLWGTILDGDVYTRVCATF